MMNSISQLICRLTGGHIWIYNAFYSERACACGRVESLEEVNGKLTWMEKK